MSFADYPGTTETDAALMRHEALYNTFSKETKMQPRLLGFTGLKGSGKDAAGEVFTQHGWKRLSFAEPLKAMVRALMVARGCGPEEARNYTDGAMKELPTPYFHGRTARYAMQTLGTEWGRNLMADDLWIDTFNRACFEAQKAGDGVVITDVRFPNEVDAIHKLGGGVFRIDREGIHAEAHASEAQVYQLAVDGTILNNFPTAHDFQVWVEKRFF